MSVPLLVCMDRFLAADQHGRLRDCLQQQWGPAEQDSSWFPAQGMQASLLPSPSLQPLLDLLELVLRLFQDQWGKSLPSAGLEWWINRNTSHAWHLDKDECLLQQCKKLRPADRSFLYYVKQPQIGGELELMPEPLLPPSADACVTQCLEPCEGRLLSFDSRIYHRVRPYQGDRLSIAMNAWCQPPLYFSHQRGLLL